MDQERLRAGDHPDLPVRQKGPYRNRFEVTHFLDELGGGLLAWNGNAGGREGPLLIAEREGDPVQAFNADRLGALDAFDRRQRDTGEIGQGLLLPLSQASSHPGHHRDQLDGRHGRNPRRPRRHGCQALDDFLGLHDVLLPTRGR
ncbi:hypothetical protein ABIC20_002485 [Methylobacterium radiotolerans]|uniref:Uncharacterized protein n=1 Tax=Methylobacterium radiotolerans TaxID=31998 RepID=A0ABV2NFA6_9HYPH|nr:hypothetical protein [Methylobacterium tardum]URD34395.1 hypothetical protein M6G65_17350 [Methylobacterium tardum]